MADTAGIIDATARAGTRSGPSRWAGVSGIAFVVLFLVSALMNSTPNGNDSDAKWTSYFASSSHRVTLLVAGFLLVIAALCLMVFFATLWTRVAETSRGRRTNPLAIVAAGTGAAGIAIGAVLSVGVAGGMIFGSLPEPSASILRVMDQLGWPVVMVAGMIPFALAIAVVSLQARAAGAFGAGLTVFSLVMAVITLASFLFFPLLAPLLWVLVVSIVLIRRPGLIRAPSSPPATPSIPVYQ
jgi:hypothetical protein